MNRETFLKLSFKERAEFFNKEMAEGKSITQICNAIGISKSQTATFKNHGYVLENNKYVHKQGMSAIMLEKLGEPTTRRARSEILAINGKSLDTVGRPPKEGEWEKHTISIRKENWKDLKEYSISNNTTASDIIDKLVEDFLLKEEYGKRRISTGISKGE